MLYVVWRWIMRREYLYLSIGYFIGCIVGYISRYEKLFAYVVLGSLFFMAFIGLSLLVFILPKMIKVRR